MRTRTQNPEKPFLTENRSQFIAAIDFMISGI
jgi:hypothetical protein